MTKRRQNLSYIDLCMVPPNHFSLMSGGTGGQATALRTVGRLWCHVSCGLKSQSLPGLVPELYLKIYVGVEGGSAQAPTYTGEAYWNYGWLGVVVVSILIGLELGWFTRKWLEFIYTPESGIGALIFCVPVAVSAFSVESWIAATYIGGFVTLAILIKFTNFIAPNFIRGAI